MTDKTTSTPTESPADEGALVPLTESAPPPTARRLRCWHVALSATLALVLLLVVGAWYAHQRAQALHAQWSAALAQSQAAVTQAQTQAQQAFAQAQQALNALQDQTTQLAALQNDYTRLSAQVTDLAQTATVAPTASHHPAALLSEVAQQLKLAQQLSLRGQVADAALALEATQTLLMQAAHPTFDALQNALQQDLTALRAVPALDISHLTTQLDTLAALIQRLSFVVPTPTASTPAVSTAPTITSNTPPDAAWWQHAWLSTQGWLQHAWQAIAHDLHGLIQVRRIDNTRDLLMTPEQIALLRSTLQHRIAAARLALLMHEPGVWATELGALQHALDTALDPQAPVKQQALALLSALRAIEIPTAYPTLTASLSAVQSAQASWARGADARPLDAATATSSTTD